jgi:hypothetical protein
MKNRTIFGEDSVMKFVFRSFKKNRATSLLFDSDKKIVFWSNYFTRILMLKFGELFFLKNTYTKMSFNEVIKIRHPLSDFFQQGEKYDKRDFYKPNKKVDIV